MRHDSFHGLFLALLPPAEIRPEIARWRDWSGCESCPVEDDRLHITLISFGCFAVRPDRFIARVREMDFVIRACRVVFDLLVFGHKSVLLKPSEKLRGVRRVQGALDEAFHRAGIRPGHWSDPHITLHYDRRPEPTQPIDAISWAATELVFIESLHGRHRHIVQRRWRLILD